MYNLSTSLIIDQSGWELTIVPPSELNYIIIGLIPLKTTVIISYCVSSQHDVSYTPFVFSGVKTQTVEETVEFVFFHSEIRIGLGQTIFHSIYF